MDSTKIGILGCGRVGRALAIAVQNAGCQVVLLSDQNRRLLLTLQKLFRHATVTPQFDDWPELDILFIAVNDDQISPVAKRLALSDVDLRGKVVAHTSGALTSEHLQPLKDRGAYIASFHPVQTFTGTRRDAGVLRGSYFALEGDPEALESLKRVVERLDGRWVILQKEQKVRHHLACVLVSNYVITLMNLAVNLLQPAGLEEEEAKKLLLPLMKASLQNIENRGLSAALTGPISRGDVSTIRRHLRLIQAEHPELLTLYLELAKMTVELARKQQGTSLKGLQEIRDLLQGTAAGAEQAVPQSSEAGGAGSNG